MIHDQQQRQQAIDPQQSIIVQAPAGSGKTELLSQRFLALLAQAKQPEEIVALTFTRKAAAEMRQRVMHALQRAQDETTPDKAHEHITWQLARAALQRDQQQQWSLQQNPNRLRIQTLDALCAMLSQSMPVISQSGAQTTISQEPDALYQAAIQQWLLDIEENSDDYPQVEKLLLHLDNSATKMQTMLATMLSRREQWLPYVMSAKQTTQSREALEHNLQQTISTLLVQAYDAFPPHVLDELIKLVQHAAHHCQQQTSTKLIVHCLNLESLPPPNVDFLPHWQGIVDVLLTKNGTWRKTVDIRDGFPSKRADDKAMKKRMKALLDTLTEHPDLRLSLVGLRHAPDPQYSDTQWEILHALLQCLPRLVAELKILFSQRGQVDFAEVAHCARLALGDEQNPSDLALSLDYRIQHILVDEFQDTSLQQYQLLEQLTAGWTTGDGRTLFLVGDPMQSIYRFRQAEVGLFLQARQQGIGDIRLIPLRLSCNFRSQTNLVSWVNQQFSSLFPQQEKVHLGAITYSPSHATHALSSHTCVHYHASDNEKTQAKHIVQLIKDYQQHANHLSIAILVRARRHLIPLIPELQAASLGYQAVEIDSLAKSMVVQDLTSLTRAVLHLADRVAWLSLLRSPWCGLSLHDITALAADGDGRTLLSCLLDTNIQQRLSEEGRQRARKLTLVLQDAWLRRSHHALYQTVYDAWLALDGPSCCQRPQQRDDASTFFDLLREKESNSRFPDWQGFMETLQQQYAKPKKNPANLHIMTIHKAKGLEFDVVILPYLEKSPAKNKPPLLLWQQQQSLVDPSSFLLAPIKPSTARADNIYTYLWEQEKIKQHYETMRLLYVACTRAKRFFHLTACLSVNPQSEALSPPLEGSLLSLLWQESADNFWQSWEAPAKTHEIQPLKTLQMKRLPLAYFSPVQTPAKISQQTDTTVFTHWQAAWEKRLGIIIHQLLKIVGDVGLPQWQHHPANQAVLWKKLLQQQGFIDAELDTASATLQQAMHHIQQDPQAAWIFGQHEQAQNEYAITTVVDKQAKTLIIDRTFVDRDTRWIIDYKTALPVSGQSIEDFLHRQQQHYAQQLQAYATALQSMSPQPVKWLLYFPLLAEYSKPQVCQPA